MEFVVFDFETTGLNSPLPVEVGLVRVKDGSIVEQFDSLVHQKFIEPEAQKKHGISLDDLRGAPQMSLVALQIAQFVGKVPMVAHNADFDLQVVQNMGLHRHLEGVEVYCSMRLSAKVLKKRQPKLSAFIEHFGHSNDSEHRALGDAMATAKALISLMQLNNHFDLALEASRHGISPTIISAAGVTQSNGKPDFAIKTSTIEQLKEIAAQQSIIHRPEWLGAEVVFTGNFSAMSRTDAVMLALRMGAVPKESVNRSTKFVVVGNKPGAYKYEKALSFQAQGLPIQILTESEFLAATV